MDEALKRVIKIKELFSDKHLKELEGLCGVWRTNITDNTNMEYFHLGRRSVYQDIKRYLEADINELKQRIEEAGNAEG